MILAHGRLYVGVEEEGRRAFAVELSRTWFEHFICRKTLIIVAAVQGIPEDAELLDVKMRVEGFSKETAPTELRILKTVLVSFSTEDTTYEVVKAFELLPIQEVQYENV